MKPISEEEYLKYVEPALIKVFKDCIFPLGGAIRSPFQDPIESRILLFAHTINPFWESLIFWNALSNAILELGDREIFQINTMGGCGWKYNLLSEKLLPDFYSAYQVVCSIQGNWGLLFDVDGLSLLGGSTSFINNIRKSFPEIDQQIYYFFEDVKWNIEWSRKNGLYSYDSVIQIPEWLPNTLIHIYGESRGKELLDEARTVYR